MPMPRTGGLKPARPGQTTRSTQRIVIPSAASGRLPSAKPATGTAPTGRINLPVGMILRCLPQEVLAEEVSKFEANGKAATEIGLPMNMILGQLPSGKVEMTLQDLLPHFPAGYLQPTESIQNYLSAVISLPLMDVVMRIPPDLLALRPDQKDVDSAVINMADPFTEEILREQAEASRRAAAASTPNIIEESQAPQEEFVPSNQLPPAALTSSKPVALPRRPQADPLLPTRPNAPTALATPPAPSTTTAPTVPIPPASGQIPLVRPTTPLPGRPQAPAGAHIEMPSSQAQATPPVPPVPRHTGPIPAPPPPRHTTSLPVPRRTGALPETTPPNAGPAAQTLPGSTPPPPSAPTASAPTPSAPDSPAVVDNLARLAALAMEQMGEGDEATASKADPTAKSATPSEPITTSVPAPAAESVPAKAADPTPMPPPAPVPAPASIPPAPVRPAVPRPEAAAMPKAPAPFPPVAPKQQIPTPPQPAPSPATEAPASTSVAFNLNTCTAADLVHNIPECSSDLAEAIVEHRERIGSFKRLEDLLDVPGITKAAYKNLTGEEPPTGRIPLSLNELLGFPIDQEISLKDVTERIACWPDVTGCVLSQSSGLSLVGTVPPGVDKAAVVAFAPRMFEALNKSFSEVSGQDTDALVLPTTPTSFHMFRNKDLYLIITCRLPQMPERHLKVARFVLAALSIRKEIEAG